MGIEGLRELQRLRDGTKSWLMPGFLWALQTRGPGLAAPSAGRQSTKDRHWVQWNDCDTLEEGIATLSSLWWGPRRAQTLAAGLDVILGGPWALSEALILAVWGPGSAQYGGWWGLGRTQGSATCTSGDRTQQWTPLP